MPEKMGNGGHGPEEYDINTGKYKSDGVPNKYYDNPKENKRFNSLLNNQTFEPTEEKVMKDMFGLDKPEETHNIEPNFQEKIYMDRGNDVLKDDGAEFEYPEYYVINNDVNYENQIFFLNEEQLEKHEEKIIKEIAFRDLLKFSNGQKEFPVVLGDGTNFTIRSADDLYYYIKSLKDKIDETLRDEVLSEKFKVSSDDEIAETDALSNIGMTRDEYIEYYNSMPNVKFKMGQNAKKERKAVITLGLPASGKSITGDSNDILSGVEIDADIGKDTIPEYQKDNSLVSAVHNMSGGLRDVVLRKCLEEGYNVSLPIVGKSTKSVMKRIKQLKEAGYDIQVAYVDVPFEQNIARAATRAVKTGRYTSIDVVSSNLGKTLTVFNNLKNHPDISGYIFFDNREKHKAIAAKNWKYNIKK